MAEYALGLCLSMCPCLREKGGFYIKVGRQTGEASI